MSETVVFAVRSTGSKLEIIEMSQSQTSRVIVVDLEHDSISTSRVHGAVFKVFRAQPHSGSELMQSLKQSRNLTLYLHEDNHRALWFYQYSKRSVSGLVRWSLRVHIPQKGIRYW